MYSFNPVWLFCQAINSERPDLTRLASGREDARTDRGLGQGRVADSEVQRVLRALNADFDAAIAKEEDVAATDLALSLLQDALLSERLTSSAYFAELPNGVQLKVVGVGSDYVTVGRDDVVPLNRAVFRRTQGSPPMATSGDLLGVLRSWVRVGSTVRIEAQNRVLAGHLAIAGRDHVGLETALGEVLVPLQVVDRVRRIRGG